jgi:hypothetical protein
VTVFEDMDRVNFIDSNNVLVGFEAEQQCCEEFGYFILDKVDISKDHLTKKDNYIDAERSTIEYPGYLFDQDFLYTVGYSSCGYEDTQVAVFRLTNDDDKELFLHIFNTHNGYYSHGFFMDQNGEEIKSGSI